MKKKVLSKKVRVVEVGPRDGLQNEARFRFLEETELVNARADFVIALADAGLRDVEAGAFVRTDRIPQMLGTAKVIARIRETRPDLWKTRRFGCLVPNPKGMELAVAAGVKDIAVFTSNSDAFSSRNINMSVKDSLTGIAEVMKIARREKIRVRGYISTVWGCPYAGKTSPKRALSIAEQLLDQGAEEISLGDTIGVATPNGVESVLNLFSGAMPIAVHFHDTRGTALANTLRALELGIRVVDSSAGGLGGCPYARGAAGNLATEDLLYMLQGMKFTTGVDLNRVCSAGEDLAEKLELSLPSRYHRAWKASQVRPKKGPSP